tara:strand:+ start:97 stop:591 length:495 start_codon:yes stop_codon:yes gene_type:complete
MALVIKNLKEIFLGSLPLILLLFLSLTGNSVIDFKIFSINIHYILVYFWVLRQPDTLGYGFIFLAGLISDVVFNIPLGVSALALLIIAATAAYVRVVTVRITLINDWISFFPALLLANLIYFLSLFYSDLAVDYFDMFKNSLLTFVFYPILWVPFSLLLKFYRY